MNKDKPCFTEDLPNHFFPNTEIIALEFADMLSEFNQILSPGEIICDQQMSDRVQFFIRSVKWDFGYIISYGLLFFFIVLNLSRGEFSGLQKTICGAIVLVCLLDVGENIFLLRGLHHFENASGNIDLTLLIMFIFAFLKWTFLFFYCMGVLYLSFSKKYAHFRTVMVLIYLTFILIYLFFPFSKLPTVGNGTQLIIFASLPVLIISLIQAVRAK
jgi:hypothetical protein